MNIRLPVQFLLLLSGAAALAHQVLWTRCLVDVLGASAGVFARVVGAFFVGLALGGAWAALYPVRPARGWRRVALAEMGVGILAVPVLLAVAVGDGLRGVVPAATLQLGLPFLLVLPPAVLMGLVLPAAAGSAGGRVPVVRLYGLNTLGGVLGIVAVSWLCLPRLGTLGSGLLVCGLNLAVGTLALWLARRDWVSALPAAADPAEAAEAAPEEAPPTALPGRRMLAFLSGFLVLGLEVAVQQQFAQITINSYFSSATVLAGVLLALVLATAGSGIAARRLGSEVRALNVLWLATALALAVQPYAFRLLRPNLVALEYTLPPAAYFLRVTLLAAALVLPLFLLAGFAFPLLLRSLPRLPVRGPEATARRRQNRGPARELALLLAVNGLGGWLGAEFTQLWLLPRLGLWLTLPALALVAVLGRLLTQLRPGRVPGAGRAAVASLAVAVLVAAVGWRTRVFPQVSLGAGDRLVDLRVGREGVVATVQRADDDWRIVFNNSYTLGGSKAQANQERQGLLPLLLHGHARSVGLLGVATGSTTAGAALGPDVTQVEAVELSAEVIRFARDHFRPFNRDIFSRTNVQVRHEDARWIMTDRPGAYDVVVGDLFLPWRTGEGRLFTAEHFATVRRALKPDGLFCQWLPLFQLTRPQFDAIVRTFRQEFPEGFLVRGDFYTELPIVGLGGGRSLGAVDWDAVENSCERVRRAGQSRDPLVRHVEGVALMVVGPLPDVPPGPINTLGNAWLEWAAADNIIGLRSPWLIGVPAAEIIREQHRLGLAAMPTELRPAHDSGQFFLTLSVADKVNAPVASNLRAQILDRLPVSLRRDADADWRQWPARQKPFGRPPPEVSP